MIDAHPCPILQNVVERAAATAIHRQWVEAGSPPCDHPKLSLEYHNGLPTGRQVFDFVRALWEAEVSPDCQESAQVQRLKKFMNFIGEGIPPSGRFLHEIRRVQTQKDFFAVCAAYLDHDSPMPLEPSQPGSREELGQELVAAVVARQ